jgi:hypothetical protein
MILSNPYLGLKVENLAWTLFCIKLFKHGKMKVILFLSLLTAYSTNVLSQIIQWAAKEQATVITTNGQQFIIPTWGLDVCTDSENNVYVTGSFAGQTEHEPNEIPWGAYLNKYGGEGNLIWSKMLPYADLSISIDNKDIIHLSGMDSAGYFVCKYHKDGTEFNKTILFPKTDSYNAMIKGIATDAASNYYITGKYRGVISFGATTFTNTVAENHLFLAKYNSAGAFIWARSSVSGQVHFKSGIKADSSGNCYIYANYGGQFKMDGQTTPTTLYDALVGKYDTNGNPVWLYTTGGSGMQEITAIQVDVDENVFVLGNCNKTFSAGTSTVYVGPNDVNVFLLRLNVLGHVVYSKSIGGSSNIESAGGIDVNKYGEMFISGSFRKTMTIDNITMMSAANVDEVFMAKFDNQGNACWVVQSGCETSGESFSGGVGLDRNSNLFVTGEYSGTNDFGGNPLTGDKFLFVAKILPGQVNGIYKNSSPIQDFNVYPIPSKGSFRASITLTKQSSLEINIINSMGEKVHSEKILSCNGNFSKDFELEKYPRGIYFIEVRSEGSRAMHRQILN